MKKLSFLSAFVLLSLTIQAQPWMPVIQNGPINLQSVIEAYKSNPQNNADDEEEEKEFAKEGIKGEAKNYQFDRWAWYWNNHTDENGNLVSPQKTYDEWKDYLRKTALQTSLNKTTGTQSNWSFEGPTQSPGGYNGIGRINTIAFHPTDANTLWIGSAGGGVWKTTDEGATWVPVYNNLPILGVSDIKFNPLNPNTVYLCSGDGDGSDTYSIGVFKTTDGGATWDSTSLFWNSSALVNCNSIIINPQDTNTILVATSIGVYRSFDAGATWTKVLAGSLKQLTYNPADTSIIYVTGLGGTATSANIYMSHDGGTTWLAKTSIFGTNRVALAVTPQNPAIVKAIVAASSTYALVGIYSSSDTGNTFVKIYGDSGCSQNILANSPSLSSTSCDGQGWYDLCIAINPLDSNEVLAGGVNTWLSIDGGQSWNVTTQWYSILPGIKVTHADKHFLGFNPISPSTLYEGNDGGIQQTFDVKSQIWTDLTNGLGITQFYRIAVSNNIPSVLGGAQDNGCKQVESGASTELTGGDGMQVYIDFTDPTIFYTESQYGSINISTNSGGYFSSISNNISGTPTGSWITPYVIAPALPNTLLAGYDKIYESLDQGNSWTANSPVFVSGATIDRLVLSFTNTNYIYALVKNAVHYSIDFGTTWKTIPLPSSGTISDIMVDPKNENNIWLTYSGYGTKKVAMYSLTNTLLTDETDGLPNIPALCIQIDSSNGTIYIGTDVGVFYRDTAMTNWALYNTNLPNVIINDLQINYTTDELWAGTFGRGLWKTPKYDLPVGISIIPFADDVITIAPNPNKGAFIVTTASRSLTGQQVSLQLINSVGQIIWQGQGQFNNNGQMSVNATGVPKGVYLLDATREHFEARKKVVIY